MQLLVDIPERYLLETSRDEWVERFKLYTALLMFQSGKLSAGAACEFAGVDRYTFLAACKQHRIDVIDYDAAELAIEFEQLKNHRT
ncbi:UPF0175 family protein [Thioflexithrix psekupsensis]|uniref:Uncharacterized protein n=1 Tax=Thioflexithrix psekupsensis TaxID=1570016 RepID=A0A251X3U8_9GAMM|nr:UPF0175 family protein [Thioflexithrix psekupsensis]OUD12173.1 hypothetical protein TPSD3_13690 [Thioflexithrix psekupsensis]